MRLPAAPQIAYGEHPDQCGNLHLPPSGVGPGASGRAGPAGSPVVVLLHGGFWRRGWDRTLMTPLARDLARRGIAAWNVDYRRVGQEGGGWPGTLEDVAAAIDAIPGLAGLAGLEGLDGLDPGRVVVVGHSAGGHLALWLAARARLPAGSPGSGPLVRPRAAVSLAGIGDLVRGAEEELGDGACAALLGEMPAECPERYEAASPAALLPLGVPQLLVHGGEDDVVPLGQSRAYADAARRSGDEIELLELPEADHLDVIEPDGVAWGAVAERLPRLLGL